VANYQRTRVLAVVVLLFAGCSVVAQLANLPTSADVYSNKQLAFHYKLPSGMRDKTVRFTLRFEDPPGTPRTLNTLLAMSSGPDSNSVDWRSITIVTYPRGSLSELDDAKARGQMSAWLAQSKDTNTMPKTVVISGQIFAVSVFSLQEGTVKKGAVVFTTIRKGRLLSFAFAANSAAQLKTLTETMKTLGFF